MIIHLGLGDNLICNGLVRVWLEDHPNVHKLFIPCRHNNIKSVAWMFRDLGPRLELIPVPNYDPYKVIFDDIALMWDANQVTNLTCFNNRFDKEKFDQEFYRLAGVDFEARWQRFFYKRDKSIELPVGESELRIIHDDPSRNYILSRENYPQLEVATHVSDFNCTNIFRLVAVLEGAKELHVINSSIYNLMETLNPCLEQERFWHFYARADFTIPTTKQNWIKL